MHSPVRFHIRPDTFLLRTAPFLPWTLQGTREGSGSPSDLSGAYRKIHGLPCEVFLKAAVLLQSLCFPFLFSINRTLCHSWQHLSISLSIHSMITFTMYSFCLGVSSLPFRILCHFSRHPLQQVAVACWAIKTGCPRIGQN